MTRRSHRSLLLLLIFSLFIFGLLTACRRETPSNENGMSMVALDRMPVEVKNAPAIVQQAYQFNVANPDVMTQIPCYCGCGAMGHTSNYACYVKDQDAAGVLAFDEHAIGCSICVDITHDVMRLLDEGRPLADIRQYVDQTYAQYGPSNMQP